MFGFQRRDYDNQVLFLHFTNDNVTELSVSSDRNEKVYEHDLH